MLRESSWGKQKPLWGRWLIANLAKTARLANLVLVNDLIPRQITLFATRVTLAIATHKTNL